MLPQCRGQRLSSGCLLSSSGDRVQSVLDSEDGPKAISLLPAMQRPPLPASPGRRMRCISFYEAHAGDSRRPVLGRIARCSGDGDGNRRSRRPVPRVKEKMKQKKTRDRTGPWGQPFRGPMRNSLLNLPSTVYGGVIGCFFCAALNRTSNANHSNTIGFGKRWCSIKGLWEPMAASLVHVKVKRYKQHRGNVVTTSKGFSSASLSSLKLADLSVVTCWQQR